MQGNILRKNDPEYCPVLIDKNDTQDLVKCEDAAPDTIKKCEGGIPNIRFQGFTDDWEQRKVSGYASFLTGNGLNWNDVTDDGEQECILYGNLYTDYGMIADEIVYKTNAEIKNPVYSEYGDVLIPASDTTPTGLARATSLEKSGVLLGGDINVIRPIKGINGSCLSLALNANKKELIRLIKGTTVRHIHNSEIKDIIIGLPKSEDEQIQISSYFKQLDNLINLHQRKCDETRELKKYMIQKMFPKEGEKVPEIRFQGFTGEWEQRKIGDILRSLSLKPYLMTPEQDGKFEIIQQGNDPIIGFANGKPCEDFRNTVIFGDHTLSLYKPKRPFFVATDGVRILQGVNEMDGNYLLSLLERNRPKSEGYKRYYSILADKEAFFTDNHDEQAQIGSYFRSLDSLITLHQRKSDELKELKQYMLRNMFPQKI